MTKTARLPFMIVDRYDLLPYIKVFEFFASQWICLEKRDDYMIKISRAGNNISNLRIFPFGSRSDMSYSSYTKGASYLFQNGYIVSSQVQNKSCMELREALADIYLCEKTSFPICKSGQPITELIRDFEIKPQSSLHHNPPCKEPTNPPLVLLRQEADGKRINGLVYQLKSRRLPDIVQDSMKQEHCQENE